MDIEKLKLGREFLEHFSIYEHVPHPSGKWYLEVLAEEQLSKALWGLRRQMIAWTADPNYASSLGYALARLANELEAAGIPRPEVKKSEEITS